MDVAFKHPGYARLEFDRTYTHGFSTELVILYRKRLQFIRAAHDERDFYAMKSWHVEKLAGKWSGQISIRLNRQWRLILELRSGPHGKSVMIDEIADDH